MNFYWGFANLVLGLGLITRVGTFDVRDLLHLAAFACGTLAMGTFASHHFGRFHGGNAPERS